jgi:hypothetical protein
MLNQGKLLRSGLNCPKKLLPNKEAGKDKIFLSSFMAQRL